RLTAHDVPNAPVHSIPEAMQDPEVRHLKLFHQMEHPRYGSVTALHRALRLNGERESDPLPPPALGEHTESVLEELGFSPAEVTAVRSEKILEEGEGDHARHAWRQLCGHLSRAGPRGRRSSTATKPGATRSSMPAPTSWPTCCAWA